VENLYYGHGGCLSRIKKKFYRYDFDEATKRNKCIELISDKCNTYGDPKLCNTNELNNWINETNFERNKIYPDGRLEECRDTYEHQKQYSFNVAENKCNTIILKKGQSRDERDANGKLYYQTEDACENANFKYLTFNISGCHEPESRTHNELENTVLLRKKTNGEIIEYNPYNKIEDSNDGKYGIINTIQIWENGRLMPKYRNDYNGAMNLCRDKKDDLDNMLR
jgi:hypothetical protein